jgi:hypothetical protein
VQTAENAKRSLVEDEWRWRCQFGATRPSNKIYFATLPIYNFCFKKYEFQD